jgi:hypothetical protein
VGRTRRSGHGHAGRCDLALGIAGRRHGAQRGDGDVLLGQRGEEALDPPGAAHEDQQQAGGERVQRAGVAGTPGPEAAADRERDVVRRLARRLVDEDETVGVHGVRGGGAQLGQAAITSATAAAAARTTTTRLTTSATERVREGAAG